MNVRGGMAVAEWTCPRDEELKIDKETLIWKYGFTENGGVLGDQMKTENLVALIGFRSPWYRNRAVISRIPIP
jgi:hypothetical protein